MNLWKCKFLILISNSNKNLGFLREIQSFASILEVMWFVSLGSSMLKSHSNLKVALQPNSSNKIMSFLSLTCTKCEFVCSNVMVAILKNKRGPWPYILYILLPIETFSLSFAPFSYSFLLPSSFFFFPHYFSYLFSSIHHKSTMEGCFRSLEKLIHG